MITLRVRLKSIMKHKKYQNKNNEDIYVLHFPGTGIIGHENIISENLDRPIQMDSNLSIISIMNQDCYDKSFVVKQCVYNNIPIFNTAINEQKWNNCMKINHILECLEQIKTDYVLILDGRDTLIVNDLDATLAKMRQEGYEMMAPLNNLFHSEMTVELIKKAIPFIHIKFPWYIMPHLYHIQMQS